MARALVTFSRHFAPFFVGIWVASLAGQSCAQIVAPNVTAILPANSTLTTIDVLAHATDAQGYGLSVSSVSSASHGTTSLPGNPDAVLYVPAPGYAGPDSFTFTVSDGHGGTANATTSLTISPPPPAPAVTRVSAPMVAPSAALAFYGPSTTRTPDPSWAPAAPEVAALARALGAGRSTVSPTQYAQNVYDYIRNNISNEFRFGLGKGARGALIDQSATPFDQAELMMKLLGLGGVPAVYQLGNVTLTAQQFGQWTGLVTGLNQASQSFTVDAQTACEFLADGGIPAVINGIAQTSSSYCITQISGNLTSVSLLHIWVETTGNGFLFDPSFKPNLLKTGVNLPASLGCGTLAAPTCGSTTQTAALSGATTGTLGSTTIPFIQNANESAVLSQMTTYATALEAAISRSSQDALQDIVGGPVIDTTYAPVAGPTLPYAASISLTWTAGIPDQYRSQFSYQFCGQTLASFADELAGRRLRRFLAYQAEVSGVGSLPGVFPYSVMSTFVDDADLLDCQLPYGAPPVSPLTILSIQPPYAAGSGYGQSSINAYFVDTVDMTPDLPVTFAVQMGESSDSSVSFMADLQEADPNPFVPGGPTPPNTNIICNAAAYYSACHMDGQATSIQRLLTHQSRAEFIASQVTNSAMRHHARLGYLIGPGEPLYGAQFSVSSTLSTESKAGDAPDVDLEVFAHLASLLEGALAQQEGNGWEPLSGTTSFILSNRSGTQILDITPANMAQAIPLLSNYSISSSIPISTRAFSLQALADAGYESIIPQNAVIGVTGCSPSPPGCPALTSPDYEFQAGAVGFLLAETFKGGSDPMGIDPAANALAPTKRATESQLSAAQGYTFDGASGQVTLRPKPDIVTGSDPFPRGLPFQRAYQSGIGVREDQYLAYGNNVVSVANYSGPDTDSNTHLGAGWQHNYEITAQISSDASLAMGEFRGSDAFSFITGAYVDYQLLRAPSFDSRVTGLFVDYWTARQLFSNVAHIKTGAAAEDFSRLPDGTFNPPPGGSGQLIQTAAPLLVFPSASLPVYDYAGVNLKLTNKDGSLITFDTSLLNIINNGTATFGAPQFKADSWAYPDGTTVGFTYSQQPTYNAFGEAEANSRIYVLNSVANNLGRSLTFATTPTSLNGFGYGQLGYIINSVADESGRVVTFALSNCPTNATNHGAGAGGVGNALLACNTLTVTEPSTPSGLTQWTYSYAPGSDSPDPAIITRPSFRLRRWYTPGNQTTPYDTIAYDALYHAATATDILGHTDTYYVSAAFTTEGWKRTDDIDALGNLSTSWFDQWNDLTQGVDPLGRRTTYAYDGLHRRILETRPELDQVATTYDARSNVLTRTDIPKPGSPLAASVTGSAYEEGPTVYPCVNPILCNQPATTFDALAYADGGGTPSPTQETAYAYSSITGQVSQIRKPADVTGAARNGSCLYLARRCLLPDR
jgi:YD repeat-containing protein